jgi:LuxR family maltose regulon positive regulatory protein
MVRPVALPTTSGQRATVPTAKTRPGLLPPGLIRRERLVHLLSAPGPPVTLVSGAPGYGKTTMCAGWAHLGAPATGQGTVAWVNVDHDDNDPHLLWSAILQAVGDPVDRLVPPRNDVTQGFLAQFGDLVDHRPHPTWLVLDDVHHLTNPVALAGLDRLLRALPAKLRLVLICRTDPPLSLQRLRLHGLLREIRTGLLAFTRAESAAMLAHHGITPTDDELDHLMCRTEGWPTGVRLAALALADPTTGTFTDHDPALGDYFTGEVLRDLPADLYRFLLRTSTADSFTADLAGTLTGRDDAGAVIDQLTRVHALAIRCHRDGWYRYHPLLRAHLRTALHADGAPTARCLHRLAATWFADHEPLTALRHAVASADEDLTADLLARHGLPLLVTGAGTTLRTLVDQLPGPAHRRPQIGLLLALAELVVGDVPAADLRLDVLHTTDDDRLQLLRVVIDLHRARLTGGLLHAVEALGDIPTTAGPDLRLLVHLNRGTAMFWLGDHEAAAKDLQQAYDTAAALHRDYATLHCLTLLAGVAFAAGEFPRLAHLAEQALDFGADRGWSDHSATCYANVLASWAAYHFLEQDRADQFAHRAVKLLEGRVEPAVALSVCSVAATLAFDRGGDPYNALTALRKQWSSVDYPMHPAIVVYSATVEVRMALLLGRTDWAAEAETRTRTALGDTGDVLLLRAFQHVHQGRVNAARALLAKITGGEHPCHVVNSRIYAHLLAAQVTERAHTDLLAALELAEPRNALRPFLDTGPRTRELLTAHTGRLGRLDPFAAHVLDSLPAPTHSPGPALSPRELDLLRELPSMRTLDEIAGTLFVSVNTVKTHLRSVYRKLAVATRRDAIHAARQRGLL